MMSTDTIEEQLVKYLTDVHSIEEQALVQMKVAPGIAGNERIASAFSDHLTETEGHERLVSERLEAHGARPSKVKDLAGTLTGAGFGAFAKAQPDTPGKLVAHAFSYEHMEEAAYDLLGRVAHRAGDNATVEVAGRIEAQEHAMGDRLAGCFDLAVDAALRELDPDDLSKQLDKYLADAHALEAQALVLLGKAPDIAGSPELASTYSSHREETEEHQRLLAARLDARGASPSRLKDAALSLGALNWGAFFAAQPDTPAKLAAFAYAFEHLEVAAYELLRRVAARVADDETEHVADRILGEENAAAAHIRSLFELALDASLAEQGVAAR
jgi:ferritin-like metal-binding protein YciE